MEEYRIKSVVESLLLVSERPVSLKDMEEAADGAATKSEIEDALGKLRAEYESPERGMRLREAASGWQLHTPPDNAEFVKNMLKLKPVRISGAAMEALAIVAYRQPVTRPEIEEIRGVDCGGVLKILLDRRLVRILGKRNEVGRPFIYGTTKEFLEFFHLNDLSQLPTLKDFEQLSREFGEQIGGVGAAPGGEAAEGVEAGAAGETAQSHEGATPAPAERLAQLDEGEPLEGSDELLGELTDAMTRLDVTRKSVVKTLGLKATETEGEGQPGEGVAAGPGPGNDSAVPPEGTPTMAPDLGSTGGAAAERPPDGSGGGAGGEG